jgi:PhnB protein
MTMSVTLNPYVNFRAEARAAMEFYQSVFGGELNIMTFGEGHMGEPADADKVMHAQLEANGMTLMASDAPEHMPLDEGASIGISLSGDDEAVLTGYWEGLVEGATIVAPLVKAPWGDTFGMLTDRFGVGWLVNISGQAPQG